jgi:hypothetical protein
MTSYMLKDIQAASPATPPPPLSAASIPRAASSSCSCPTPRTRLSQAMWVTATAMANGACTGTLANHPSPSKDLPGYGDPVTFQGRYIITVMP